MTKQDILDIYSDVFYQDREVFQECHTNSNSRKMQKPMRHAPRKAPIHLRDAFHNEIRNLEKLGILEETKDVTEWVNSFVIMEKKTPVNSSKSPTNSNSSQGTLQG